MDQYVNGHSTHRAEWRQKPERIRPREPKKDQSMIKSIYRVLSRLFYTLVALYDVKLVATFSLTLKWKDLSTFKISKTLDSDISMTDE